MRRASQTQDTMPEPAVEVQALESQHDITRDFQTVTVMYKSLTDRTYIIYLCIYCAYEYA